MASEEMSFENIDGLTDPCLYYKLIYEPSAQVSLKHIYTQQNSFNFTNVMFTNDWTQYYA